MLNPITSEPTSKTLTPSNRANIKNAYLINRANIKNAYLINRANIKNAYPIKQSQHQRCLPDKTTTCGLGQYEKNEENSPIPLKLSLLLNHFKTRVKHFFHTIPIVTPKSVHYAFGQ